jgi:hypothetical protein
LPPPMTWDGLPALKCWNRSWDHGVGIFCVLWPLVLHAFRKEEIVVQAWYSEEFVYLCESLKYAVGSWQLECVRQGHILCICISAGKDIMHF